MTRRLSFRLAVAAAVVAAGAPVVATSAAAAGPLVRYNIVLPGLSHARFLRPARPGTALTVGVGLLHPHPRAEQAAFAALYDRSSSSYHAFLTPQQYDARFGVPAAQTRELEAWLRSGGLQVQTVSGSGDYVTAHGTVAQVGRLMRTRFGVYRVGPFTFVANQVGPEVPRDLPVDGVLGLNTLQRVWTPMDLAKQQPSEDHPPAAASGSYVGTLVSADVRDAYDVPSRDQGQGETAGVFGDGYFNSVIADLRMFEAREGLPRVPVRSVLAEGGKPSQYGDNAESIEWMLDTQSITGMAPKLRQLDLYFAKQPLDADIAAAFAHWASEPSSTAPEQMNASFGECESDPTSPIVKGTPYTDLLYGVGVGNQLQMLGDQSLRQAAMEGRTLFAAAGDTAGACPFVILPVIGAGNGVNPQPVPTAGYPAVSDYAVAVGGTVLTTNGTTQPGPDHVSTVHRTKEVSWVFSGGGAGARTPEPAWQKPVAAVNRACIGLLTATSPPQPITPGTVCRGTPDVAAMSGQGLTDSASGLLGSNGYEMSADGLPFPEGGTSLSSPLTVGMWSDIQAASPYNVKTHSWSGLGFAAPLLYQVGLSKAYHHDFYDITDSDVPHGGNVYYQNAPGWDYVSGWGVMDTAHLIADPQVDNDATATPTHPHGAQQATPSSSCRVTMTSPPGNAYDFSEAVTWPPPSHPQLDLTRASLAVTHHGADLTATLHGPALSTSPPTGSTSGSFFYVLYQVGSATKFLGATVSESGKVTYLHGHTDSSSADEFSYVSDGTVPTGSFHNGTLTITAPVSKLGLHRHQKLAEPYAVSGYPGSVFVAFASDTAANPARSVRLTGCTTTRHHAGMRRVSSNAAAAAGGSGALAKTGVDELPLGIGGLVLLGAGLALARRRRSPIA